MSFALWSLEVVNKHETRTIVHAHSCFALCVVEAFHRHEFFFVCVQSTIYLCFVVVLIGVSFVLFYALRIYLLSVSFTLLYGHGILSSFWHTETLCYFFDVFYRRESSSFAFGQKSGSFCLNEVILGLIFVLLLAYRSHLFSVLLTFFIGLKFFFLLFQ